MFVYQLVLDKNDGHYYILNMTTAALLLREIETMPEETAVQVLDFAKFFKEQAYSGSTGEDS